MNGLILVAASLVACPWSRPVYYSYPYAEPLPVYLPCTPVYRVTPLQATSSVAVEQAVVATDMAPVPVEKDAPVTDAVSAKEESVLEPAGFRYHRSLTLPEMALDWGLANIGPGTLWPTPGLAGQSAGGFYGPGSVRGQSTPSGGTTVVNNPAMPSMPMLIPMPVLSPLSSPLPLQPPSILDQRPPDCNCCCPPPRLPPPQPSGGPQPVPEPVSIAVWTAGLFLVLAARWSHRRSASSAPALPPTWL